MADITMCDGKDCPLKDLCYRFTATRDEYWQPMFHSAPFKDKKCDFFWSNE